MNTWNVFFLFPGIVYFGFFGSLGSEQTKNRTGGKPCVCFGAIRVDTEFLVSILFLNFFRGVSQGRA
jgi:hypothetical protein